MKNKNTKSFIYILSIIVFIVLLITLYGFYEKNRKAQLYKDFRANKRILCGNVIIQKDKGWTIRNNKFFTDGKTMKTIVFCKSIYK